MRVISLDQLTVRGVSPTEFADIAADAGYDAVSPMIGGDGPLPSPRLAVGDPETEAMVRRLRDRGVAVNNLDGLVITPGMDWDEYGRLIELALHIGAQRGVTLIFDPDASRAADSFARATEMARLAGLPMVMEFTALSEIATLREAGEYIARSGEPVGVVVDLIHLAMGGETPADLARWDPSLFVCAQICDGPAHPTMEQYQYNAFFERQIPGDGDLPVVEFLAALPADAPIGVEVPLKAMEESGVSHLDRAKLLRQRVGLLLEQAASHVPDVIIS